MWSYESPFTLDFHDDCINVHRLPGQRFATCRLREHDWYGGGSAVICAAIWYGGRSELRVVDVSHFRLFVIQYILMISN